MKILVTGADGMVGSYVKADFRYSRIALDVVNAAQVESVVLRDKPDAIIHLAALTDMKQCEEDRELADKVNAIGARNIALAAKKIGAKVVYVSTNAVFDGTNAGAYTETDKPNPMSEYGRSKLAGEKAVLDADANNLVVRTSWIFGGGPAKDKKFIGKIAGKLRANEAVKAVDDVRGTPTYAKDLAIAIGQALESGASGIMNIVNAGDASRYDMMLVAKEAFGSSSSVTGAPLASFGPTGNSLRNERLAQSPANFAQLRPWQEALKEYILTEWQTTAK